MSNQNLRHRAERLLNRGQSGDSQLTAEEIRQLAHELSVHQVELEMQNEELRSAQLQLEQSRQEYFDLFHMAPVAFIVTDLQSRVQKINREGARLLQASVERLMGQVFYRYILEPFQKSYYEHQQRVLRSGGPESCELQLVAPGGGVTPVRIESVLQQADESQPLIRSALVDQTESRRAWGELEKANRHLKQQAGQMRKIAEELTYAEQRERQRLAKLLHDHLQQLLVAAKINLELTHTRIRSANLPSRLNGAEELCEKAEHLIAQSLATSRSLAVELSPPVLQDGSLLVALRWLARWMLDIHGLTVELDVQAPAVTLPENIRISLFEIVRELLLNVVKHAGVNTAWVTVSRPERTIRIIVADQGIGFDASKTESDNTPYSYGMLTIRHRISWMQGEMSIDSAPGRGCRVQISIPEFTETPAASSSSLVVAANPPASSSSEKLRDDPRIRVLVVDDHQVMREGLAHIILLEPGMLVVGEAANGREAVELTRQVHPDVVVMDINMPEMNGIEATRLITAENPRVQVIGLSMHQHADMSHAILDAGAVAYISKGSSSQELISTIRQHCEKASLPA